VGYTFNGMLFSLKKERNSGTCYDMNLKNILLSEINQIQKDKYYRIPLTEDT